MEEAQRFVGGVRELDLANYGPVSVVDRVNVVQGLRTSAAFFTFLRANLALSATSPSSPISSHAPTPHLEPYSHHQFPIPPSPSPLSSSTSFSDSHSYTGIEADASLDHLDDVPPLSLEPLLTYDDKVAGLNLIADSVAQMKQRAARSMVFHPLCMSFLFIAWGGVYRWAYDPASGDPSLALLLSCGVTMTYLTAIRYFTDGYVNLAENLRWSWLEGSGSIEGDLVIGARYGGALIGVLILRLEPRFSSVLSTGGKRRNRSRSVSFRGGKGVIRAWTTRLRYRGKGIGRDLLDGAIRIVKERCGKDAEVGFAQEHANSSMLLPAIFNGAFRRDEMRAAKALEKALEEWESSKRKKRS
ncbi:gcn5-related n-acetyltransferase gnat domain-containing [Trichoderma arundinaceum]|uniref:Gcn5-related n-acetyltransferase gnat domain-containing n=1 Tax=Trichoderma arundinaceum TaxID=490622 RepID=A0A395NPE4_TRIAR|nr:gcn5-related n-acetyltransferase gnat domain-containing [Trichoderma arundinaceum]